MQDGPCNGGGRELGKDEGACCCTEEEPDCSRIGGVVAKHLCAERQNLDVAGQRQRLRTAWQRARWRKLRKSWEEVVLPVAVVLLGGGFSVAALWVSLSQALWPKVP